MWAQTEGSQIIQLFGRGVRLKGYDLSLKRSGKTQLPDDVARPKHIGVLETLGIFGIHADYMAQFREFLEEEGLPTNEDRIEFLLPVIKNLGTQKLNTIRLKKTINGVSTEFGDAFRKLGPVPTLAKPDPVERQVHRIPAEESGRPELVPEDPSDEVGRRRGRRCGSRAQPDTSDGQARRVPRPGPTVLRAGTFQG